MPPSTIAAAARAIEEVGGRLEDAVRTRVMLKDIERWPEAARGHGEVFRTIRPAFTVVGVSRLIDP
jgi:enamine deaminase RidA (YjgF/YER057c/UK114 family)